MIEPRLILCSGAELAASNRLLKGRKVDSAVETPLRAILPPLAILPGPLFLAIWGFCECIKVVKLDSLGSRANVHICFEDVARTFHKHLSPRLTDLVEIASYVFSADCGTRRGKHWFNEGATESWDRDFTFVVPVRDYAFWNQKRVRQLLEELLAFLSDDAYKFNFRKLKSDRPNEPYLEFSDDDDWPFSSTERVLMFSGGLDSLAGVIDSAERDEHLVLVSHRSNTVLDSRQRRLVERLRERYPGKIIHIPIWLNKGPNLDREHTQRTRSFLYTALGRCRRGIHPLRRSAFF